MSQALIQLFAKPPIKGKVKTRLIPEIGEKSATAVYQHCLKKNIELVKNTPFDYQIWLTETSSHPLFKGEPVKYQKGKNLGEKMFHALSVELQQHDKKVILIGSDCLDLTTEILNKVCEKLQRHDLVFIPALDGGYVLIAAKKAIPAELFKDIEWGSEWVLRQTIEKAMQLGINTVILNQLRDIDRVDDLQHYAELKQYL